MCKQCFSKYCMERWRDRKKQAIQYLGGSCNRCKKKHAPEIYDFHHVVPGNKDFTWQKLRLKSWESITKELDKCELVCANCHRYRHIEMRK